VLDKPDAKELLEAMAAFLAHEVVPELRGRKRFHALVSANVARILAREAELAPEIQEREIRRLRELLGADPQAGLPGETLERNRLELELSEQLIRRIDAGDADHGDWGREVFAYLKEHVADKLRVDNPKML